MTYIAFEAVDKRFEVDDGEVHALSSVSLGLERGELVSLVGPSGCGKSTLLRILGGLIPPTTGAVLVDGEAVRAPRSDAGIVFQSPVLLPWRSVLDNVLLPVDVAGRSRREYLPEATRLLKLVGLEGFGDRYPWQLSGGMQQRAAICRALVLEPTLLLMDEPFGALDAITRDEMGVELLRIWSEVEATVLFITHSIPEAVFLSDRVVVMTSRPGRILEVVPIDLPRPRTWDTFGDPRFGEITGRLRVHIEEAHAGGAFAGSGAISGGAAAAGGGLR